MDSSMFLQNREKLAQVVSEQQDIGIIVSGNQNLDTMGAGLALYLSLKATGKNAQIVSSELPIVEISNLFGINKVKKEFQGSTRALTISIPYKQGEIEKVSYNIEEDRLNVNLIAEENGITFSEDDVKYIRKGSTPSTVFTLGIPSEEEVYQLTGGKNPGTVINIDNSGINSYYGDLLYVDPSFSSLSEIIAVLISQIGLPMDQDIAQNLLDGIIHTTNNFTSPTTSAFAFETAGILIRNGAKRKQVEQRRQQQNQQQRGQRNEQRIENIQHNQRHNQQSKNANQSRQSDGQQTPKQEQQPTEEKGEKVPSDWFMPKIYRGNKKHN